MQADTPKKETEITTRKKSVTTATTKPQGIATAATPAVTIVTAVVLEVRSTPKEVVVGLHAALHTRRKADVPIAVTAVVTTLLRVQARQVEARSHEVAEVTSNRRVEETSRTVKRSEVAGRDVTNLPDNLEVTSPASNKSRHHSKRNNNRQSPKNKNEWCGLPKLDFWQMCSS